MPPNEKQMTFGMVVVTTRRVISMQINLATLVLRFAARLATGQGGVTVHAEVVYSTKRSWHFSGPEPLHTSSSGLLLPDWVLRSAS